MGTTDVAGRIAAGLIRELRTRVDPARREHGASYFNTDLEILGVAVPDIRRTAKAVAKSLEAESPEAVLAVAQNLVDDGTLEGRQAGYELVALRKDARARLGKRRLDRMGRGNDNWGSVDSFASTLAGPAWRAGLLSDADVETWARSSNPWWRRTALVCTVSLNLPSRGGTGDTERTMAVCEELAHDHHPAVEKALSWALRSLVRHDPAAVRGFLDRHGPDLGTRVVREVRNKLETGLKSGHTPGK